MTSLSLRERTHLTWSWRQLSNGGRRLDLDELEPLVVDAQKWASPFDSKGKAYLLFGLAKLAFGYVRATGPERVALAPLLTLAATQAGELLDALGPPPPPFRADIDG